MGNYPRENCICFQEHHGAEAAVGERPQMDGAPRFLEKQKGAREKKSDIVGMSCHRQNRGPVLGEHCHDSEW